MGEEKTAKIAKDAKREEPGWILAVPGTPGSSPAFLKRHQAVMGPDMQSIRGFKRLIQ